MTGAIVHSFTERLEWSEQLSDEPSWVEFYRKLWPNLLSATKLPGPSWQQERGIDRRIELGNGRMFTIDEKKREKDYGDILLETHDDCQYDPDEKRILSSHRPGWAMNKHKVCDFVAYAVIPAGKVYLLPFEILRLTLDRMLPAWQQGQDRARWPIAARNNGYWTINVGVPWAALRQQLTETMVRSFGDGTLRLPDPFVAGEQQTFCWARTSR